MAGNDDIAREVADLLFDQTVKSAAMAARVAPKFIQGVGSVTSITLGQVIDEIKKNKALQEMLGMEGEISMAEMTDILRRFSEKSSSVQVGDADANDYDALLQDQGVLFAKVDRQDDNCKLYIFLNRDIEKVENATRILHARRGQVTELNSKLYFNSLAPDQVHVVEGLSPVEMELFRHYARENGLLFTTVSRKEGDMVVCGAKDAQKARQALLYTGWALTGANGARVREQIVRRLAGRTAINIAAEEGTRELFIVSQTNPGNYVHISADDCEVYKQNKQVFTVSRAAADFYEQAVGACEGLAHPVVMSSEQFRQGFTAEELQDAHTIDLFPDFHDDMIEIDRINRLVNLVALKSGLDDEHNATWGIWDPSVSYSEFATYENIMDEEEREARAFEFDHFKDAAFYSENHHTSYEVDMKEKNVDYIIARAEQKRRLQEQELGEEQELESPEVPDRQAEPSPKKTSIAHRTVVKVQKKRAQDKERQEETQL